MDSNEYELKAMRIWAIVIVLVVAMIISLPLYVMFKNRNNPIPPPDCKSNQVLLRTEDYDEICVNVESVTVSIPEISPSIDK